MTGTPTLSDPDGSKRAAMAASLEYGTHPIVGQHLYRTERYDAQTVLQRPVPTIPRCPGRGPGKPCGKKGPLYAGLCHGCTAAEEREEGGR